MEKLKRILHVDDDEDIRVIARMTLELVGHYEVEQFDSGEAALSAIDELSPQLMLLDFMMPKMSGEELWKVLSKLPRFENVPVIFMTAKTERSFLQGLLDAGALEVIVKPFEPVALCRHIEEAWARHCER